MSTLPLSGRISRGPTLHPRGDDFTTRSLISPINKLPPELLSSIFYQYIHCSTDSSVGHLIFVSKRWKQTALSTPSLWCNLQVANRPGNLDTKYHLGGDIGTIVLNAHRIVCHDIYSLDSALPLSGGTLLAIDFNFMYEDETDVDDIQRLCLRIFDRPVNARIQEVSISGQVVGKGIPQKISLSSTSYPALTTIKAKDIPPALDSYFLHLLRSASSLKRLHILGRLPALTCSIINWDSLHYLDGYSDDYEFYSISHRLGNLRTLEGAPYGWPNQKTHPMTFKHLRRLDLRGCAPQHLHNLQLPSLRSLYVGLVDTIDSPPFLTDHSTWSLPSLSLLCLRVESQLFPEWFPTLSAPLLEVLDIMEMIHLQGPFPLVQFPSVRRFNFFSHRRDDEIIDILHRYPAVTSLTLRPANPSNRNYGKALLRRLADVQREPLLCPRLSEFVIGPMFSLSGSIDSEFETLMNQIPAVRTNRLTKLQATWVFLCSGMPVKVVDFV